MSNDKMREKSQEQFEAWARHDRDWEDDDFRLIDGVYYWGTTGEAWLAWQASREALVIELPPRKPIDTDKGLGYNCGRFHCQEAIQSSGLKVK